MEPFFPSGMKIVYPYDTTPFVKISIHEVVKTLVEAIILVFLVMYLFLQNFRATLIRPSPCRWSCWGPSRSWRRLASR
jgi:multidrug efflux pump subunit AcrB